MLNYVWLGLLMLGIGVALSTDIVDKTNNKYQNGEALPIEIIFEDSIDEFDSKSYNVIIQVDKEEFNNFYKTEIINKVSQSSKITFDKTKNKSLIFFNVTEDSPEFWKGMAKISGKEKDLTGEITLGNRISSTTFTGSIILEEIAFARMKEVSNSALEYAGIAVNIALGLIGIKIDIFESNFPFVKARVVFELVVMICFLTFFERKQ